MSEGENMIELLCLWSTYIREFTSLNNKFPYPQFYPRNWSMLSSLLPDKNELEVPPSQYSVIIVLDSDLTPVVKDAPLNEIW